MLPTEQEGHRALEQKSPATLEMACQRGPRGLLLGFLWIQAQLPKHRSREGERQDPSGLRFHTLSLAESAADSCHERERRNSVVRL